MDIKITDNEEIFYIKLTCADLNGKVFNEEAAIDKAIIERTFLMGGSPVENIPVLMDLQKISQIQRVCYQMNTNLMVPKIDS